MAVRTVVAGFVASLVMGMWQMVVEALIGKGFWSPVVYIAATVLRDLQSLTGIVQFDLVPVVLGLMGHMMNSVILGIIFVLLAPKINASRGGLAALGVLWGVIVFVMMRFGVLPLIDPVMLQLNTVAFFFAHVMWGGALGLIVAWNGATEGLRPSYAG